jgi:hypothetical protein
MKMRSLLTPKWSAALLRKAARGESTTNNGA